MSKRSTYIALGDGCLLRSLDSSDADSLAKYADNRNVWRNLRDFFPSPYKREDALKFIAMMEAQENETAFAISEGREAIGVIGFNFETEVLRRTVGVGYWLGGPFWGRGIMTRALPVVCEHIFRN